MEDCVVFYYHGTESEGVCERYVIYYAYVVCICVYVIYMLSMYEYEYEYEYEYAYVYIERASIEQMYM